MLEAQKNALKKCLFLLLALLMLLSGCTSGQARQTEAPSVFAPAASENSSQHTPAASEEPPVVSTPESSAPAAAEEKPDPYFTKTDEEVTADEAGGRWLYRSPTLFVEVRRFFDEEKVRTYFVADIRLKETEKEIAGFGNPKKPGSGKLKLYEIQQLYQSVIAVNGDYMHRVEAELKGIIMREGKVLSNKKAEDTLAFFPDGTMRIFSPKETTPQALLDAGVKNTFSFGPTLIRDGIIKPKMKKHRANGRSHPRTAVGMIEPYHFVLVVVDGRQQKYSKGIPLDELAALMADLGCTVAYNLDGGASSTMSFMGSNINKYHKSTTGQRNIPDALMFGFSGQVQQNQKN